MTDTLGIRIIHSPIKTCVKYTLLGLLVILLAYQLFLLVNVILYRFINPSSTAFMRIQALNIADDVSPKILYNWSDYEQIDKDIKKAIIASEDSRFTQHFGVEWQAIIDAYYFNLKHENANKVKIRGGSTISQQLAKNLFLSQKRSYLRKAQELVITYMIEIIMPKQRIYELYLNTAQLGERTFGVTAASRVYFKQDVSKISSAQAATLAALLPNPILYSQHLKSSYMRNRINTIQARMPLVSIP
ncbi:monofunctional biosynthetic peptidoglycan transglycosylase [Pelistega sp. MC2]|uniref:monofunctional biosynthetic peptidoglycan transglycosylase n=1 Tax=Pelistega sp. MC2 TaxID=1720297 RepID=UPI0008D9A560|nr:monofunctional biosynthetic peptidoglycan transglycosylase [Pelistega sp. MC2]